MHAPPGTPSNAVAPAPGATVSGTGAAAGSILREGWARLLQRGALVAEEGGVRFGVCASESGPVDFVDGGGHREVGCRRASAFPDLVLHYCPARGYKPGGGRSGGEGAVRPAGFEGDGRPCRFLEDRPEHPHALQQREVLMRWEGARVWAVLPNLSPYEPAGTFLAVPSPAPGAYPHEPQRLDRSAASDLLDLAAACERHLCFFNAGACGASVNHRHLQVVALREPLPVERARVEPGAGGMEVVRGGPAEGLHFDLRAPGQRGRLLDSVEALEHRHPYYNLLAIGARAWLFARPPRSEPDPVHDGVPGGYELAGVVLFTDAARFREADPGAVALRLSAAVLPWERWRSIVG